MFGWLIQVVLPIAVGSAVYVGWRSETLLVFRWINAIGLSEAIYRPTTELPYWVLYCLPDACWVYAGTSAMLLIWGRLHPWCSSFVLLGIGGEIGQLTGHVPGTYDSLDVSAYLLAFLLALVPFSCLNTPSPRLSCS